jgi:alpha-ribazole phosphatase
MTDTSKTLYFLRHGELEMSGVLAGSTDFCLSEEGYQQMLTSTRNIDVHQCISSPLRRCFNFAANYSAKQHDEVYTDERLREMDFGLWDGRKYSDLWKMPKPNIGDFWHDPETNTPPHGESVLEFNTRVLNWWDEITNDEELVDSLIVTHAGVIKVILANIMGLSDVQRVLKTISVDYGSVVKVTIYRDGQNNVWPTLNF